MEGNNVVPSNNQGGPLGDKRVMQQQQNTYNPRPQQTDNSRSKQDNYSASLPQNTLYNEENDVDFDPSIFDGVDVTPEEVIRN